MGSIHRPVRPVALPAGERGALRHEALFKEAPQRDRQFARIARLIIVEAARSLPSRPIIRTSQRLGDAPTAEGSSASILSRKRPDDRPAICGSLPDRVGADVAGPPGAVRQGAGHEDDPEMGSDRAAHAIEDQRAVEPNPLQSDQTTPTVEPTPEPTPSPATTSHALLCNVHVAFMICRTPERRARR